MTKNRNLIKTTSYNFKLRSRQSMFIGSYIILATLLINTLLTEFTTDGSPVAFLTVNYLEALIVFITVVATLLSLLALFIGNRRYQRSIGNKIWNTNSRKMMYLLFATIIILYGILYTLLLLGEEAFIIPTAIIGYGILLMCVNISRLKSIYIFTITCILIGFLPLYLTNYGFHSLILLGISHYIFSFISKPNN